MIKIGNVLAYLIRRAVLEDARQLGGLCALLWPDGAVSEHQLEIEAKIRSGKSGTLPVAVFVVQEAGSAPVSNLSGFIEAGLRSHADGCDTANPVGYIEGWFVREPARGQGIGARLLKAAEDWARELGCVEMASDALIDNDLSQRAHEALGFDAVDRCVHFKKHL